MEVLFFIEPIAYTLRAICIPVLIISAIAFIIGLILKGRSMDSEQNWDESEKKDVNSLLKYARRVLISAVIVCTLISPFAQPLDIYKKVLIYRGVNSETAEKAIENINTLLDLTNNKMKEFAKKE